LHRRRFAGGHPRQRQARSYQRARHQHPTPEPVHAAATALSGAEGSGGQSSGVHAFGKITNGRSAVKTSNKGWQSPTQRASMATVDLPELKKHTEMTSKLTDQLTDRQARILEYIRYQNKVRNYPPSVREIGEAVGLSSSSTVHNHLNQLERRGLIR